MNKWNLPLTYAPKIEPVIRGECTQSIRVCGISKRKGHEGELIRKQVGDLVRFYVWTGRPYWSSPEYITEYTPLIEVWEIDIRERGIMTYNFDGYAAKFYTWVELDWLAALDYINPPTGEALRNVLMSKNRIPAEGVEAQILRWEPVRSV